MLRFSLVVACLSLSSPGHADDIDKGRALAENCSPCHQIGAEGESPLAAAPPFRHIGRLYEVGELEEALVEGIVTAHSEMPEFVFEPSEAAALVAYLEAIQED
jgi:mono/diheme cytochrome c family protein